MTSPNPLTDPRVSDEVRALARYLAATGVPHRVTTTIDHKPFTSAGYPSRHVAAGTNGTGLAMDIAGPTYGRDTDALALIYRALAIEAHALHELIYGGPQVTTNVKNGRLVPKYASADHHDHVHVSVNKGVLLVPPHPTTPPTSHRAPQEDDMPPIANKTVVDTISCFVADCHGWFELEADGGVLTQGQHTGDHFQGSYFDDDLQALRSNNPQRMFLTIASRRDRRPGYTLWANDGAYVDRPV